MFFESNSLDLLVRSLVLGPVGLIWIVLISRIIGLRTFSKMTAFDFVATVATGSLLAGAASATSWSTLVQNALAVLTILGMQAVIARVRMHSQVASAILQNEPVLLVRDGEWCEEALRRTRVTKDDIWAKFREANVLDMSRVRAAVLETTGDVSVLHGDSMNPVLLSGTAHAGPGEPG